MAKSFPNNFSTQNMEGDQLEINSAMIKTKLANVLHSDQYCGLCLEECEKLLDISNLVEINDIGNDFQVHIMQILLELFHYELSTILCSKQICQSCLNLSISSYIFVKTTKVNGKVIQQYLKQIDLRSAEMVKSATKQDMSNATGFIILRNPNINIQDTGINENYVIDFPLHKLKSEKPYTCDRCQKTFVSKDGVKRHISKTTCKQASSCRKKYKKKPPQNVYLKKKANCPQCTENPCQHEKYLTFFLMTKVLNSIEKKGRCADCDNLYATKEGLLSHVNSAHLNMFVFTCDQCGVHFYSKRNLKHHITYKHLTCSVCNSIFDNKSECCRHVAECKEQERVDTRIIKTHESVEYECLLCTTKFSNKNDLQIHKTECTVDTRSFKCNVCPASFHDKRSLKEHMHRHNTENLHSCNECPKKFPTMLGLIKHQGRHKAFKTKFNTELVCFLCDVKFIELKLLKNHLHDEHGTEEYGCKICSVRCENAQHYLKHTQHKRHLNKIKIFLCPYCDFIAKSAIELESHANTLHLGRSIKCDFCGKKFLTRSRMLTHKHLYHDHKDRKYHCEQCATPFTSNAGLMKHMRLHTGERPYTCNYCNQSFISTTRLADHKKKQHSEKDVECPLCGHMFHLNRDCRNHIKRFHWKNKQVPFNHHDFNNAKVNELFVDLRITSCLSDM